MNTSKTQKGSWHDDARAMRAEGVTYAKIAKHFGVSAPAVYFAINPHKRIVVKKSAALIAQESVPE